MRKRFIARVTRVGSGLGIIIPSQLARDLDITRGSYWEFRTADENVFCLVRVVDPMPAQANDIKL